MFKELEKILQKYLSHNTFLNKSDVLKAMEESYNLGSSVDSEQTIPEQKNELDAQYLKLLGHIIKNGVKKQTRNGEVISVFGYQIRHKMSEGFPLLTTKKMAWKQIVTELMWFLRGDTNIKFLIDNNCHIWNGDALKNYEKQKEFQ